MSASLIEIQKRIDSTRKTSQITSAMQMVSASKLTRSEAIIKQYEKYAKRIKDMVLHLAYSNLDQLAEEANNGEEQDDNQSGATYLDYHDMLLVRPVLKTAYLIIASDQGLAGGYNSSIFSSMLELFQKDHDSADGIFLMCIGDSAKRFFEKAGYSIDFSIPGISDYPTFDEVRDLVRKSVTLYRQGEFDELYVCYNHHVNALVSNFRVEKMLPLVDVDEMDSRKTPRANVDYLFEPSKEAILEQLLPQYAESLIYGSIVDAKTAEHAARMTAMRNATDNAKSLISDLTTELNQSRQAQITQEITEIVGGAAALE